jgi:hypothetical protein
MSWRSSGPAPENQPSSINTLVSLTMRTFTLLTILSAIGAGVLALPAADPAPSPGSKKAIRVTENSIEKRADGGVFLCTDINFSGNCVHIVQPNGECSMSLSRRNNHHP